MKEEGLNWWADMQTEPAVASYKTERSKRSLLLAVFQMEHLGRAAAA